MIKPTVGRVMWYWPFKMEDGGQPYAAIVTRVWGDNMVNLAVFDDGGVLQPKHSVPIVQDGSPYTAGASPYCEWMPYQLGQAAKAEALETKLKGAV